MTSNNRTEVIARLQRLGIEYNDAWQLRRISMTLQRWYELECGDGRQHIERDEKTGKPYLVVQCGGASGDWRFAHRDLERGAERRLAKIMARYPDLVSYLQTDPRGASLYIMRKSQIPVGVDLDCCYSSGVAVYK